MDKTYSLKQIEAELSADDSAAVLEHERRLAQMRAACKQYGLEPSVLWLSDTGRFTMAQIVAAYLAGNKAQAKALQAEWEAWTRE